VTQARQVFKGRTVAVAHRCSEQRFFLRPSRRVNQVLGFLLAVYAARHGIELHGFAFMGNHFHLILTDTRGRLPLFMGEFDSMVSRVLNHELGRRGRFWESTPYASWELKTREEVLQHLAYVAANPTEAAQVRDPSRWRGLLSLPEQVGLTRTLRPPARGLFGRGDGSALPSSADLSLTVPPYFSDPAGFRRLFRRALDATLQEIFSRIRRFAGRNAVLDLDPFSAPVGAQSGPSFTLIPALTNASAEDRAELKAWRQAMRQAFHAWRAGKDPVFPAGAWLMPHRYGARVAPS
jgi:REP-associated tyrosine transposase